MSSHNRAAEQKKSRKNARRYNAPEAKKGTMSWEDVNAEDLKALIIAATEAGGAIRFGASRDGGALALGVYGDGDEAYTLYAPDSEEIAKHLSGLIDVYEAIKAER